MSTRPLLLAAALLLAFAGAGCGGDDECVARAVPLSVTVDGRAPGLCGHWELQVRTCGLGDCRGGCGACTGEDDAVDPECPAIDACEAPTIELPPGPHRLCVRAELVNGGVEHDACATIEVPAEGTVPAVAIEVGTENNFPCIRDWTFNGAQCCNAMFGCVAPEA